MLSFIYTENYKNLKFDSKVDLKNLNIFIGPNGSGKSNLISYLKFLNQCLQGEISNAKNINNFEFAISQLSRILDIGFSPPAKVRLVYGFLQKKEFLNSSVLDLKLYVPPLNSKITIAKELLYQGCDLEENLINPLYYYKIHEPKIGEGFEINNTNNEQIKIKNVNNILYLGGMWYRALLDGWFDDFIDDFSDNPRIDNCVNIISWSFYNANDMNLEIIRNSEPKIGPTDTGLSKTGDNLALVIDNLSKNLDFEDALNLAMKSIFPKTRRIRSARVGRLSLTVEWFLEGNNEPFYLNEMSDGTVRMLCWAVILHSPDLPALLAIDEPELGLHPAWLSVLAQWIKKAADKTQIILTTHSPDLLDHFTDCVENVYCFYPTDPNHYGLKPLSKEVLQTQLEDGWELGDLYRVGDPTVGGWPW